MTYIPSVKRMGNTHWVAIVTLDEWQRLPKPFHKFERHINREELRIYGKFRKKVHAFTHAQRAAHELSIGIQPTLS